MTSGCFWNYHRHELNLNANEVVVNYMINDKATTSKFFEYKIILIRRTPADYNRLNTEVVVSLKNLSNF